MSDNWLNLVPVNPYFAPAPEAVERLRNYLDDTFSGSDLIKLISSEHPQLIHPMGNWSGVACPECDSDLNEWWWEQIGGRDDNVFENMMTMTPCCSESISLNDLKYEWPTAFGRFVIELENPNIEELPKEIVDEIESILGEPIRQVWAHL